MKYNRYIQYISNPDELTELYINQKKGTWAIAKLLNTQQSYVLDALRAYNIPVRTRAEASKITRNGFKQGDKHHKWVGDDVSYSALHAWVRLHKGTPMVCEHCNRRDKKKYEWAKDRKSVV